METANTLTDKSKLITVNDYLLARIAASFSYAKRHPNTLHSKTELDSHANMAVLGNNCFIFEDSGKTCNISAFPPSIAATTLPIVDDVIIYDCPYYMTAHIL